ncbi:MarR family winged helix-turn-helix transcriptional regulator [Gordonia insulae]|uniref:Putative HTH-type transcriptional regulator n=1 Tax=Gordonia insulae TaxID=2420509 RepID=A0A3G8JTQ8_9ACTN|nr:MarR family transcriptional regulator [Gordonia insulae]AZG48541.1 putative HTH-type transcriptional regulator [Gordonia insulae]
MTSPSATSRPATEFDDSPDVATLYHLLTRITRTLRTRGGNGNLTAGVAAALWTIINHAPIRLSALADRESVSAPTMSRIVASLEENGYIERTTDPDDGRAKLLSPTPAGVELITNARTNKARLLAEALDGLDDDDRSTVGRGLTILAEALGTNDQLQGLR